MDEELNVQETREPNFEIFSMVYHSWLISAKTEALTMTNELPVKAGLVLYSSETGYEPGC